MGDRRKIAPIWAAVALDSGVFGRRAGIGAVGLAVAASGVAGCVADSGVVDACADAAGVMDASVMPDSRRRRVMRVRG